MNIDLLIKEATLAKNGSAKEAYRAIKSELLLNESSKNPKSEGKEIAKFKFKYSGDEFEIYINELDLSIIRKLVREREESISMYEANSRKDLADIYRDQIKYLKELLPPEVSKEQIEEFIVSAFPNGFPKKEMGFVIKETKNTFPTADGKLISEIVKSHII